MNTKQISAMNLMVGPLETMAAKLQEIIDTAQEKIGSASEKWLESEKGEKAQERLSAAEEALSGIESAINGLLEASAELDGIKEQADWWIANSANPVADNQTGASAPTHITRSRQMIIKHVNMEDLGEVIAQLVAKGLKFEATPYAEGMWTITITGGQ
jgi:hypothetical protein